MLFYVMLLLILVSFTGCITFILSFQVTFNLTLGGTHF